MENEPKITFFVYSYNHEQYIREAINSAFNQTYQPHEIILSDDFSTDGTWKIIQEMAENYRGSAKLILNRNEKNLGITAHINKIVQIGSGEWFVLGAGDDVSLPERVQIIYDTIKQYHNAYGVATALININENGQETGYHNFDLKQPYVTGASSAWHRKCFEFFGDISQQTVAEDIIIPFRSVLLGELLLLKKPTVKYRYHGKSISNPLHQDLLEAWKHVEKIKYQLINACKQRLIDLEKAKQCITPNVYETLKIAHEQLIKGFETDIENISMRCSIWQADLVNKISYLLGLNKDMPNQHQSFYYRLKTILASFIIVQYILQSKKSKRNSGAEKQDDEIKVIKVHDLMTPEINFLIYI